MNEPLYPVAFQKIMQSTNYTLFILESQNKKFSIYSTPNVGLTIQRVLSNQTAPRPQTYDLVNSLIKGLDISPLQLVLHDVEDSIFYCKFFVEQTIHEDQNILEIDTRPSDGLVLALSHNIPILCTQKLLDKTPEYLE